MLIKNDKLTNLVNKLIKSEKDLEFYTEEKLNEILLLTEEIEELKFEKNAKIMAHVYTGPEIINTVSDYSSDSYSLALESTKFDCDTIVLAGVKFMAETAKMLNPEKTVLLPNISSTCSLAESITAADVKKLKSQYPNAPVICYINSSIDVKAEVDVVVTSSNALQIVKQFSEEEIIFIPDKLMAKNIQNQLAKEGIYKKLISNDGTCIVHDNFDEFLVHNGRRDFPGIKVLSHPECDENIVNISDMTGSTTQIVDYVANTDDQYYMILSECGLSDKLQNQFPEKTFVASCKLCPYMKMNNLKIIRDVLKNPSKENIIEVDKIIASKALKSINQMFYYMGVN